MSEKIETTLPPMAEAMSARDIAIWERHLTAQLGARGAVNLSPITCGSSSAYWSCGIHDHNYRDVEREYGFVADWPEAIQAAQAWIANRPKINRNAVIRKLALAIIGLTDEHGKCTVAMLRAKDFSDGEIELHAEACERASEMCQNSPFSVEGV